MTEHFLSVSDVASVLGVGRGTVNTYINRGSFPDPDALIGDYRGWRLETIKGYMEGRNMKKVASAARSR